MSICRLPYNIYQREELENEVGEDDKSIILDVDYKGGKAFLRFQAFYLPSVHHVEFYAADNFWHALTGTGYHSYFIDTYEAADAVWFKQWFLNICQKTFSDQSTLQIPLF